VALGIMIWSCSFWSEIKNESCVANQVFLNIFKITRVRNQRLRIIQDQVDIEAENMDAAKAAKIERLENKNAAQQVRGVRIE
jgi:hypothetical protein